MLDLTGDSSLTCVSRRGCSKEIQVSALEVKKFLEFSTVDQSQVVLFWVTPFREKERKTVLSRFRP